MMLMSIVIAGVSSIQLFVNKVVVERSITTDQRHLVEIVKEDIMTSLMYAEDVQLSNADKALDENTYNHVLGYEDKLGYMKDKEAVFGAGFYDRHTMHIAFHRDEKGMLQCTVEIKEQGGVGLKDTFPIKLLNINNSDIQVEEGSASPEATQYFKYIYYKEE